MRDTSYIDKYLLSEVHDREEQVARLLSDNAKEDITINNFRELIIPEKFGKMVYTLDNGRYESLINMRKIGNDDRGIFISSHFLGFTEHFSNPLQKIILTPLIRMSFYDPKIKPDMFIVFFGSDPETGTTDDNGTIYIDETCIGSFDSEYNKEKREAYQVFLTEYYINHLLKGVKY